MSEEESKKSKEGREFNNRSKDEQDRRNDALNKKKQKRKRKNMKQILHETQLIRTNTVEKAGPKEGQPKGEEGRLKEKDVLLEKGAEL